MKRSYSSITSSVAKRSKPSQDLHPNNRSSITSTALQYFLDQTKTLFINYLRLPPVIFKHQLYAYKPDHRTLIDRELQTMFNENRIRLFHSDLGVMLMFTNDYHLLIDRQLNENQLSSSAIEKNRLKQRFINDVLPNCIRLSIDRKTLEDQFQITLTDIHLLIEQGLLLPKDVDQYWFSIPNIAPLITCMEKARRGLVLMLSRRTYREIPLSEFRTRDLKKQCRLGFDFHVYDLIGANHVHLIDTPTGFVVKIGAEKA